MANAHLSYGDKAIELPVIEGSEGEQAVDISGLRDKTGLITLDNGFVNTGSCESAITFIDGEKGILRYRGYTIEDVCEQMNFLETAYLVIYGQLPKQQEYDDFAGKIAHSSGLEPGIVELLSAFSADAHPMSMLISAAGSLASFYPYDPNSPQQIDRAMVRYLALLPSLAACAYRVRLGLAPVPSDPSLSYAENFLNMMFKGTEHEALVDPEIAGALDRLFILHADHEQNCSTAAVRVVGSSQVNLYAAAVGGMCALWGPLHGGANQAVVEMLQGILNDGGDTDGTIARAKDRSDPFRLMGFGHRVYKNLDPRARIIKSYCDLVLKKLSVKDPLLDLAKQLEETALSDPYFVERKLFPNVDFYSGIIYKALNIPIDMFTVMFALGRLPGWVGQWRELSHDPKTKIGRPRQVYQGPTLRPLASEVGRK